MVRAVIYLAGAGVAVWLVWKLMAVLLLVFAATIVGVAIWGLSEPMVRFLRMRRDLALVLALILAAAVLLGTTFFFGVRFSSELLSLLRSLPGLATSVGARFGFQDAGARLSDWGQKFLDGGVFTDVAGYTFSLMSGATATLVVVFGGAFLALGAESYREGALLLVPREQRDRMRSFMNEVGHSLRLWMLGQLFAMAVVGIASGTGMYLLGVPSWLALGLLAGILEFIPFIGALLAYAAAVLVALSVDIWLAVWVTLLFLVIQQVESNLLIPLIQKRTVSLPPALGLFSIIAVGALTGPLGVLVAVPLTLVAFIAVRRFYVEGVLGEPMDRLGGHGGQSNDSGPSDITMGRS